jgi:DNA polymerase-3 subunit beta
VLFRSISEEGSVKIGVTEKTIFIHFGAYHLSSMLLEGQFPNYRRVIPSGHTRFFTADRKSMLEAINRMRLAVEKNSNRIFIYLTQNNIQFAAEGDVADGREEFECEYEGDDARIPLNYIYLQEPLKAIPQEQIKITFNDTSRAITLRPEPEADFFNIIMPMQTD